MGLNRITVAALACALGIAAWTAGAAEPARVRVFDAGELSQDSYTVVKRLWTGTWRAAFWIPQHEDTASAISELVSQAADAGADGIINLHCLYDPNNVGEDYYCYALAIKMKKGGVIESGAASPATRNSDPSPQRSSPR